MPGRLRKQRRFSHRSDLTPEQNDNYNTNLSLIMKECTELIKAEEPRLKRKQELAVELTTN
jgi:hypothetical protein